MRASGSAIVAHNLGTSCQPMRICLVYDCLFPHTVGGAERWYRSLAERLAADGHDGHLSDPTPVGLAVSIPASQGSTCGWSGPRMQLYSGSGRRRVLPPLVFGAGVLWHLIRNGGRYDVVHTCSFPYFSLLAAALVRRAAALPPGCRLVRGLVPGVLARLPGTPRRRRGLAGAATLCPHPAAGVLLLGAVRGAATRGGSDGRDHDPGGSLRRARAGPAGQSDGAAGCVRRQTHPGEVRPGDPAGDS